jgi:glutamate synthase domain-containing protein 3
MSTKVIDVAKMQAREINRYLRRSSGKVELANPNSAHFLAAGLCKDLKIEVHGSAGYYLGTCMHGPSIHVNGNAGWFPGDNITAGTIVIEGTSGDGTGQGMYEGTIVVKGNCGSRTGQLMKGGTILVGGNSGYMTGLYAFGGRIIVCGDVGHSAGESIIGGTLYIGGKIPSVGKNATTQKATAKENGSIKKLLTKFGIKPPRKFVKVVSLKKRVYHVDIGEG